ncbi:MAG: hypothetical protein WDO73_01640 [Ignavibacteriota bacterium]
MFQYNYSHDNEGGFMLICTPGRRNAQDNIGNQGTVIRYNISHNDRSRIFHLSGGDNSTVEHNAIYIGGGAGHSGPADDRLAGVGEWRDLSREHNPRGRSGAIRPRTKA